MHVVTKRRFLNRPFQPSWDVERLPYLLCLLGFTVCTARFFPGVWDSDTVAQYDQALVGVYSDWHPPVMSWLWRWLNRALGWATGINYAGSGLLFVVHGLLCWGAMALLLASDASFWRALRGRPLLHIVAVLSALVFVLAYEYLPMTRFVWKDVGLCGAYLMAFALLVRWPQDGRLPMLWAVCVCVCVFYGTAIRHNAVFAAYPLLFGLVFRMLPRKGFFASFAGALVVWCSLVWGVQVVQYDVLGSVRQFPLQERFFADIYGLNYKTKVYVAPPDVYGQRYSALDAETFYAFYHKVPYVVVAFSCINKFIEHPLSFVGNEQEHEDDNKRLTQAWLDRIAQHPMQYLDMRWRIFGKFIETQTVLGMNAALLLVLLLIRIGRFWVNVRKSMRDTANMPFVMLAHSAVFYVLPYYVFLTDAERRYLYWFMLAGVIALVQWALQAQIVRAGGRAMLACADDGFSQTGS